MLDRVPLDCYHLNLICKNVSKAIVHPQMKDPPPEPSKIINMLPELSMIHQNASSCSPRNILEHECLYKKIVQPSGTLCTFHRLYKSIPSKFTRDYILLVSYLYRNENLIFWVFALRKQWNLTNRNLYIRLGLHFCDVKANIIHHVLYHATGKILDQS